MKTFKERVSEISAYLQCLMDSAVFPEVLKAVEEKSEKKLIKVCKRAKIPEMYVVVLVPLLLSISPTQAKIWFFA